MTTKGTKGFSPDIVAVLDKRFILPFVFESVNPSQEYLMFVLYWIIVGLIAGWAAGKIMKGSGYGPLMDILLGIVGAIVGGFVLRLLGLYSGGGVVPSILVATLGAVIVIWLSRMLKKA